MKLPVKRTLRGAGFFGQWGTGVVKSLFCFGHFVVGVPSVKAVLLVLFGLEGWAAGGALSLWLKFSSRLADVSSRGCRASLSSSLLGRVGGWLCSEKGVVRALASGDG